MTCYDESPIGIHHLVGQYAVPQGADYDVSIRYLENDTAVDFTLYSAKMQIRKGYGQDLVLELSSAAGTIQLGSGAGVSPNVILKFTSTATSALTSYGGIYDLELTSPAGLVLKPLEGKFELRREVTL